MPEQKEERFSPRASRGRVVLLISWFWLSDTDFRLLASRTVRELISVVVSHDICGNLLQQSQGTKAPTMARNFPKCLNKTKVSTLIELKLYSQQIIWHEYH